MLEINVFLPRDDIEKCDAHTLTHSLTLTDKSQILTWKKSHCQAMKSALKADTSKRMRGKKVNLTIKPCSICTYGGL